MVGAFQQLMHLIGFSPYSIYGVAGSKRVEFCSKNKKRVWCMPEARVRREVLLMYTTRTAWCMDGEQRQTWPRGRHLMRSRQQQERALLQAC